MSPSKLAVVLFCLTAVGMTRSGIPWRFALVPEARDKLADTTCVIATSQREIDTSIRSSGASRFPAASLLELTIETTVDLGADIYAKNRAERRAEELRSALRDFVFEKAAAEAFSTRFGSNERLTLTDTTTSPDTTKAAYERRLNEARGEAVLFVYFQYYLNPWFTGIVVTADVDVCAKSASLRELGKPDKFGKAKLPVLYSTQFQSEWPLPEGEKPAEKTREAYAAAWARDGGQPVRAALSNACQEIAGMLDWDLAQPTSKKLYGYGSKENVKVYDYRTELRFDGAPVRKTENRMWIIAPEGFLYGRGR